MRARWNLLWAKICLAAKTLWWLLGIWQYAVATLVIAVCFFELVYWLFNLRLLTDLLLSGAVSPTDKLALLASPFSAVRQASGQTLFAMMIILSLIQGVTLAVLIYAIRHQPKVDARLLGGSSVVSLLAVIGLGCPACGTSILTPIVATVVSGSAVVVSEKITAVAMPVAIIVGLYGLYVLGLRLATIKAQTDIL